MIKVQFPEPNFRMKQNGEKRSIFDPLRKTWLQLTEEEWVRQNFVNYLVKVLRYPPSLIALEKELHLHELKKRFDILVYNPAHEPWLMVECKAPEVPLSEEVLQQVLRYNISLPVTYIILTNGHRTIGWKKEDGGLQLLTTLPAWPIPVAD